MCEYDATGKSAGDEVSSTYEGRHITAIESELRHPYHSDGLVDKGDPIIHTVGTGHIVGVAFKDAAAATDKIAFDSEGIWYLTVLDKNDAGNSAVAAGDEIFINTTTDQTLGGTLSKRRDFETQIPFGYALGAVSNSGSGGVCAVKVHNAPYDWDLYHSNATATADDGMSITIVDTGTATGMGRALQISYTQNGVKAGPGEVDGINIDMEIEKACTYAYGIAVYFSETGNPVTGLLAPFSCYIDDVGTGATQAVCLDLGMHCQRDLSGRQGFIRMRNHSGGAGIPDAAFYFEGTPNADYMASWEIDAAPIVDAAVGGSQNKKIKVKIQNVDYYIPLNTA